MQTFKKCTLPGAIKQVLNSKVLTSCTVFTDHNTIRTRKPPGTSKHFMDQRSGNILNKMIKNTSYQKMWKQISGCLRTGEKSRNGLQRGMRKYRCDECILSHIVFTGSMSILHIPSCGY